MNRAGTTLLHYRILRPIGSGGMGVVYEAEDSKLGRRVALKFLPPALAADPSALERFQREARAASALNHPNICTIHAIEEAGDARFIAMELLVGESLDVRIAQQPLSWDRLVDTGIQAADALDAAHRRGIIHRDIKPANLFLTADGRVKVLDFGVAKMALDHVAYGETIGVATAERALTGEGVAVGTIAYMSPEQARGETLDARTDLFSLAAVLYEMSTGRRAFDGKTSAVVFNKILEGNPPRPRELNPSLPLKLEDVILRGLEKDPTLRYQSAADLRADLMRLKRDATSGTLAFVPPPAMIATPPLSSGAILAAEARRHKGLAAAAVIVAGGLVGAAGYGIYSWVGRDGPPAPSAVARVTVTPTRVTTSGDVTGCGAISPDGKLVVYCTFAGELKVRQIATGATVTLGSMLGASTFSPDGAFVYLGGSVDGASENALVAIPALGGDIRRIATGVSGAAAFSPDGKRIAFVREDAAQRRSMVVVADATGGGERVLTASSFDSSWFAPEPGLSWSDDGKFLAAAQGTVVGGYRMRPAIVHVDSGRVDTPGTTTWADVGRTAWLPGSRQFLFAARDQLHGPHQFWTMDYPAGTAVRITNDARGFGNISVSVTADGSTLATVPVETVSNIWSTNAEATAPLEQWTSGVRDDGSSGMAVSSSGRVFFAAADGAEMRIWSVDGPGARLRALTTSYGEIPSAPSDGRFVAYQALDDGRFRIWRMRPDGTDARVLTNGDDDIVPVVSPDGRWVYYYAAKEGRIMRVPAEGGTPEALGLDGAMPVDVSADNRWLLARNQQAGDGRPWVVWDIEGRRPRTRLSIPPNFGAAWGRRPDLITYVFMRDGVSNLWEQPVEGGPPRQLTKFTSGRIFNIAYSPDKRRLFLARGQRTGDVVLLRNFR